MSSFTSKTVRDLYEAYNSVYVDKTELFLNDILDEVTDIINHFVNEGYDFSEYSWDELYESFLENVLEPELEEVENFITQLNESTEELTEEQIENLLENPFLRGLLRSGPKVTGSGGVTIPRRQPIPGIGQDKGTFQRIGDWLAKITKVKSPTAPSTPLVTSRTQAAGKNAPGQAITMPNSAKRGINLPSQGANALSTPRSPNPPAKQPPAKQPPAKQPPAKPASQPAKPASQPPASQPPAKQPPASGQPSGTPQRQQGWPSLGLRDKASKVVQSLTPGPKVKGLAKYVGFPAFTIGSTGALVGDISNLASNKSSDLQKISGWVQGGIGNVSQATGHLRNKIGSESGNTQIAQGEWWKQQGDKTQADNERKRSGQPAPPKPKKFFEGLSVENIVSESPDWKSVSKEKEKKGAVLTLGTERKVYMPGLGWQFPKTARNWARAQGYTDWDKIPNPPQPAKPAKPAKPASQPAKPASQPPASQPPAQQPPAQQPPAQQPQRLPVQSAAATPSQAPAPRPTAQPKIEKSPSGYAVGSVGGIKFERRAATRAELEAARDARKKALSAAPKDIKGAELAAVKAGVGASKNPMKEETMKYDAYDLVLEYLFSQGHVETLEEANYVMLVMDAETIGSIVEECENDLLAEEITEWVNELVEEGYDLSEYTWGDLAEYYVNEANKAEKMLGLTSRQRERARNLNQYTDKPIFYGTNPNRRKKADNSDPILNKAHKAMTAKREASHRAGRGTRGDSGESTNVVKSRYQANKDHEDGYPSITKRGQGPT